jgi:cell division protein FtsI/penicillin-binding protein 2
LKPGALKLFVLFAGFMLLTGVVVVKLIDIQIVNHEYYGGIAARQHGFIRPIPAQRGTIYDRHLKPLVMTLPAYRVCADPTLIENPLWTASQIAKVLKVDHRSLAGKLSDSKSKYKVIDGAAGVETVLELRRMNLAGVFFESAGKRVGPRGGVGRNVVGFLSDDGRALGGIELVYDDELSGEPGLRRYLRDALGNPRPCVGAVLQEPVSGYSLVLTLDLDLQSVAEAALDAAVEEHDAKGGCVIVADPRTGDILALSSHPKGQNFPVRAVFEPGSALKVCTYAAAIDLGKVDDTEKFDTNHGVLEVAGGCIRDDHPRDIVTLTEAFAFSSNVVAAMIARRIGARDFYRYLVGFGFGHKTGICLEGEPDGILRKPDEWSKRSLETLAFGQEIAVNAVQLTMAYAAVANGGRLPKPRLVKAVVDEHGKVKRQYPAKTVRTVIREETATKMKGLLEAVVQGGTGIPAKIQGIHVAGKTGTGQKAERGRYIKGKSYSVFAGFVPSHNPRYVCTVVIEDASGKTSYGGPVCGPVFKTVMEYLLKRDKRVVPEACLRLTRLPDDDVRTGDTVVPASGYETRFQSAQGKGVYPRVIGLTLRDAAQVLARAGIRWRASGSGCVLKQNPLPRAPIGISPVCELLLDGNG